MSAMACTSTLLAQVPRDTSYTLDRTLAKVQRNYPDLEVTAVRSNPSPDIRVVKGVIYKQAPGRALPANLFYPKSEPSKACIVLIHGGGWRAGDPSLMTPMAEQLAAAGYFVMVPEYRLSLEAAYPAAVEDLKDAIKWVRKNAQEYAIDKAKVVVMGCSAGGQLAALIGTKQPVQAIIDIDGVLAFKHPDSQEGSMAAQWLGGSYEEVPQVWEEASALTHVGASTPPTLFLASQYPRFLAGKEEFMEVLKKHGVYYEIHYLEEAPHSFWLLEPWFQPTVNYVLQFLQSVFEEEK